MAYFMLHYGSPYFGNMPLKQLLYIGIWRVICFEKLTRKMISQFLLAYATEIKTIPLKRFFLIWNFL